MPASSSKYTEYLDRKEQLAEQSIALDELVRQVQAGECVFPLSRKEVRVWRLRGSDSVYLESRLLGAISSLDDQKQRKDAIENLAPVIKQIKNWEKSQERREYNQGRLGARATEAVIYFLVATTIASVVYGIL